MTRWDWTEEFEREARARGDVQRVRLATLHEQAYGFRESDPDRALALYEEGRRLAQQLDEPWWVLYYQRWRVHALLHFKRDYREVIELAVRNALEARKPLYDGLPHRLSTHEDLIGAYMGVDPEGYAAPIEEALRYLQETTPQQLGRQLFLQAMWRDFCLQRGLIDEAYGWAQQSLDLVGAHFNHPTALHYAVFVFCGLCYIHYRRGHWSEVRSAAEIGSDLAEQVGHRLERAECTAWRSAALRQTGQEAEARRLHLRAEAQVRRLQMPPTDLYFDALCAYHHLGGELSQALEVRRRELETIQGWGRLAYECRTRVRLTWLRARLGRPCPDDRVAAAAAAEKLRMPGPYLDLLERIDRGEVDHEPSA